MKYCRSCGKELEDHIKFCAGCGAKCIEESAEIPQPEQPVQPVQPVQTVQPVQAEPVQQENPQVQKQQDKPKKKKKSISKGKIVLYNILAIILVLIIVAAVLLLRWYTSTEQKVLRALEAGDYDAAIDIVQEDEVAGESEALADELKTRIGEIKTGFVDGTIDYASAKTELDTIRQMRVYGVSEELDAVQTYIDALNDSRNNFATAESFYNTGDYAEAVNNYRLVIEEDANYAAAQEKLADAVNKYRDSILAKAQEYADSGLYTDAVALLNEAFDIIPGDTKITEQIRLYEKDYAEKLKEDALKTAADYAEQGDYLKAFQVLEAIMESQQTDAELTSAYNKYCGQYVEQVVAAVDVQVSEKDFDGAIVALNNALKNLPNNEAFTSKLAEVEAKKPVLLSTLTPINGGWKWNEGSPKDPFGNDYSETANYVIFDISESWQDKAYDGEYRLYGKYTTLTGVLAPYTTIGRDSTCYIQVYADDELVYTSQEVGRKTDAFEFSVDVSNAEYIKIVIHVQSHGALIMSDFKLWP